MVQVDSGRILIDAEDIANVPPQLLRTRLNCLTQEPLVLPDTIRRNADPLLQRSDVEIVRALKAVGIWDAMTAKLEDVFSTTEVNPLDAIMDDNLLSHGQRQLFVLARAMLKKSSVLLLDEPTSR
jgi:ABC-type multidrug transport system fused ATPase/permease subunit